MLRLINRIIENKSTCFFVSPHLDDAILSAGELISYLSKKTKVEIITIFTKASPKPYTDFAESYLHSCNYRDADKLFLDRRSEDKKVLNQLKIKYIYYLDFIDAAWRKKSEVIHLYPTRLDIISGKIVNEDQKLMKNIEKKLKSIIYKNRHCIIFCPLGVGKHIDHIITREICTKNFLNLIYWSDFPYNRYSKTEIDFIKSRKLINFNWKNNILLKKNLISGYKTQIASIFPDGYMPILQEYFYYSLR